MSKDLHIFKAEIGMFDPVVLQDQNVRIRYLQSVFYRRVTYLESIPPFQALDLGAVAANTTSARTPITRMDMYDDEFGLFRWYPLDNAQIRLFLPQGTAKFDMKTVQVPIDYKLIERDPNLVSTEIAVWEDNRPAIEAVNGQAYGLQAVRIIAMGYRFHTVDLSDKTNLAVLGLPDDYVARIKSGDVPATDVWCSGFGSGSR